ncbi:hypothetical protein DRO30_05920 [Candidatus Bathyarchaeota archaeon]|nr:MAG: hypothetical protein DRO30_05920 [Candidatus Bathyarchaeota archaeon]
MVKTIVGIDPGITTAIAVLDLKGAPLHIESRRDWSYGEVLQRLMEIGEVVLIASDVRPAPTFVSRIATELNAKLFTPRKVLSVSEKRKIAKEYCEKHALQLKSEHELDALSAALRAFGYFKRKFERIEAYARRLDLRFLADEVKARVLKGRTIKMALQSVTGETSKETIKRRVRVHESLNELKSRIEELNEQLQDCRKRHRALVEINIKLRKKVESLERRNAELEAKLREFKEKHKADIEKEREFYILLETLKMQRNRMNTYLSKIEEYEKSLKLIERIKSFKTKGELMLVKKVDTFTKEGIERAVAQQNIGEEDIVMLSSTSGGGASTAKMLVDLGIKVVIARGNISHTALDVFFSSGVPVIPSDKVELEWVNGLPYIKKKDLDRAIREWKLEEKERALRRLIELLREYREQRFELS